MRPVLPPDPNTRQPKLIAPPGACDTHLHVFGPVERYPLIADRGYNPDPHATIDDYLNVHRTLGLERAVIVTGSANGANNQVTLDAVVRMNGRFKALALLDPAITDAELRHLRDNHFTGFRIKANGRGGLSFADSQIMAQKMRGYGWHVEFIAESLPAVIRSLSFLRSLGMPFVFDHVGYAEPAMTERNEQFRTLLQILRDEPDAWINLYSFYQESLTGPPDYIDMVPVVRAIIAARPDRVIWGSNWPHAGIRVPMPNDGDLLDFIQAVAPDKHMQQMILCDNPARLYGRPT